MFFLPEPPSAARFSHVALTPAGPILAPSEEGALTAADGSALAEPDGPTLADAYGPRLDHLDHQGTVCVGLGRLAPFGPVVLAVTGDASGEVVGAALFDAIPTGRHFELLGACGVRFLGAERRDGQVVARFGNTLSRHVLSGLLAGFSRTGACNRFFLRHADIDADLERGLVAAGHARVGAGRRTALATLIGMAATARRSPLAMTCRPPPAEAPHPYGDLVPLGFAACALAAAAEPEPRAAAELLRRHLNARRQDGLWAFHTGRLVTATDSALILMGMNDPAAVGAVDRFTDGMGGILPQLSSDDDRPGHMRRSPETRHWCQADFGTTALVRALRRRAGLAETTPLSWIAERFATRGSLYFANPYLTDWVTALALADVPGEEAEALRTRLADEVAASMDDRHGFGMFDPALSTALAILTLAAAGRRGRLVRCAQIRLLDLVGDAGQWPASTPFYSTLDLGGRGILAPGLIRAGGSWHALSLYEDSHGLIGTALAAMALSQPCDPMRADLPDAAERAAAHPRYRTRGLADYVARFALAPYTNGTIMENPR
ncbi:hypothetical protein [Azospirillum sp. B510]|uniref:hypothetical protein n=1 Tax=Azospirillum sp. (strain B510) TaxID=137722 RepID=UPI0002EB6D76|nr:hypothetical protein [Azospirillum sp. B510]